MRTSLLLTSAVLILAAPAFAEVPAPYNSDKSTNRPLAPEAAAAQWKLPDGLTATVFAAEPEVRQPIAMAMDGRGRLWVAECYTYAEVRKGFDSELRDRIVIFEDANGDGRFDKRTVFCEDLQRLSSVEVGFGGVWAITSPTMVFIPDRDGDDRPDGPAQVMLDGFEWERNHHTMANGLRWGPDGWLYGRQGIQAVSAIGKPGAPETRRVKTNGGIWRYHPQRQTVEIVCDGTTNPWGMDWNEYGEAFFINTVIGHLWHVTAGAHYRRMHGSDLNPHVYEIIEQYADHVHWAAGERWNDWQKLGTTGATSAAGGGHAHTGLMFYGGDNWPDSWRGKLFTINFNGRRLNVENVTRDGSGYVGKHAPDIGFSADPWFRGIDLIYGPDGGVFIADWSDSGECHDNDGVFRQSGRIYKITHGQPTRPAIADIATLSPQELLPLLDHKNEFFARHARRRLQELAATGADLMKVRAALREKFAKESDVVRKLRALWSLHASGGADAAFLRAQLSHASEHVRTWAIRFLVDDTSVIASDTASIESLARLAATEPSSFVRLALASALQRLPLAQRAALARPLMSRAEDAADHNLPQMLWYGVEPLGNSDPAALASLGIGCELPLTRRCIARRLTGSREKSDAPLNSLLTKAAADARWQADILAGMRDALKGERQATPPSEWKTFAPVFARNADAKVQESFRALGAVFADPFALEATRAVVLNPSTSIEIRRTALRSLIDSRAAGLRAVSESVLTEPGLSATAADGLALEKDPAVADAILVKFTAIAPAEKGAVLSVLVSRSTWAGRVLEAVAAGKLPRTELTSFHARQIRGFNDAALTKRLGEVWGVSRDSDAEKLAQMARWKNRLTPAVLKQADQTKGRALYNKVCAACHILNGEGGKIGPELTGSGRDNLDYLLQNILDPSAAVAREFQLVTLNMKDGRALSGFVRSRTERIVVLQTLAEAISLSAADITETEGSTLSLMPEGLLEPLGENDVRDLIGYLMQK